MTRNRQLLRTARPSLSTARPRLSNNRPHETVLLATGAFTVSHARISDATAVPCKVKGLTSSVGGSFDSHSDTDSGSSFRMVPRLFVTGALQAAMDRNGTKRANTAHANLLSFPLAHADDAPNFYFFLTLLTWGGSATL